MPQQLVWWEKTVEYAFLKRVLNDDRLTFALPLDGDAEAAGDTIFGNNVVAKVIEFKRKRDSTHSEVKKFGAQKIKEKGNLNDATKKAINTTAYGAALAVLSTEDTHHYIVYGDFPDISTAADKGGKTIGNLELHAHTYFSEHPATIDELLQAQGWGKEALGNYLRKFISFKLYGEAGKTVSGDSDSEGSGKGLVVGISTESGQVFVVPLSEAVTMLLDKKYYAKQQNDPERKSIDTVPPSTPALQPDQGKVHSTTEKVRKQQP